MNWVHTLKFKIVALAVVTGVLSAVGTAQLLLRTTQDEIEALLLENNATSQRGTAALLTNKLDILQTALTAVTRAIEPAMWQNPAALNRHLRQESAVGALFDVVLASDPTGKMLVRIVDGKSSADLPNIADRPYFRSALASDQIVISDPIIGRASKKPQVMLALAAATHNGRRPGVIAGSLPLDSTGMFSNIGHGDLQEGARTLVINRAGVVLAHPESARLLGKASDEPGLAEVYAQWRDAGSPIDARGRTSLSSGYLISMAGIAATDWMLVHLTPQSIALQPLRAAQHAAWLSAAGVGLAAALLAIWFGLWVTRPMDKLRHRAMASLTDARSNVAPWPTHWRGEVGELARVFQHVEDERERDHAETQALLAQLEAVLDHADVGIALTRDGIFELVSRPFCENVGMEKRDLEGQPTRIIYPSDVAFAELSARARPQFMKHGFFAGEVELMRKSGETFWAVLRGRAVAPGDMSKGTIWTFEDATAMRAEREKLTWDSSHDALTGLANRPAFESLLSEATKAAEHAPFCTLFIDLDKFKHVNDTGGHAAGDAVLRDIAAKLASLVRKSDTVARLGGDEFAVLLDQCPIGHAREIAEKMRQSVVDYKLDWEGQQFCIGASIGLVWVDAAFTSSKDVLAAADNACYAAKHRGRNCVVVYGD